MFSTRRLVALGTALAALYGGLVSVGAPALADSGCPTPASGYASGAGTVGDPWVISTPEQMQRLRATEADWTQHFRLSADVSMTGCSWTGGIGHTSAWGFRGSFDGDGHVISGLTISSVNSTPAESRVGLFSQIYSYASITDLGFSGTVTATHSAIGANRRSSVGGLVGYASQDSSITNSYSSANVSVTVSVDVGSGGARADVEAGGLVGASNGTISNSYALGSIQASATAVGPSSEAYRYIGGLVGYVQGSTHSTISSSYATGSISGSSTAHLTGDFLGGFVGASLKTLTTSYWDTTTSGTSIGIGSGTQSAAGRTTAQMQTESTFSGWSIGSSYDATKTWVICSGLNSGYPALMAMQSTDVCVPPDITSISPGSGTTAGGTSVTIGGSALGTATSLTIGGALATIASASATTITATTPAGSAGAADVVVTTAYGSDTLSGAFSYQAPAPSGGGGATAAPTSSPSTAPTPEPSATSEPTIVPEALAAPPAPGTSTALVDGEPAASTVTRTPRTTTVTTGPMSFTLQNPPQQGTTASTGPRFPTGVPTEFSLIGMAPSTPVTIYAMSEPTLVANALADTSGRVSGMITLPESLPAGRHTLVVSGYLPGEVPISTYLGIVTAPAKGRDGARVQYALGSRWLDVRARATLNALIGRVGDRPGATTTVVVAAVRAVGAQPSDRRLAAARAAGVAAYLREHDMPGTVRVGPSAPITITTAAARRVEVTVTWP